VNVHHLELFFYIARHGGIMPAVRNIPYGIQQPAVSAQVAQLEDFLGVTLFRRRPFSLTPEGEKLFEFIKPFFSNLDKVAAELQGGTARRIRIGSSAIVLRDHLPRLLHAVQKKFSGLKVTLRQGFPADLLKLLTEDEIDVAFMLMDAKLPAGFDSMTLLELPLVLLVGKGSPLKSAEELWRQDRIVDSLVCLPPAESPTRGFLNHLNKLGVEWFPAIEASSTDFIESYVASGLGIGLSVEIPKHALSPGVRALPLKEFPSLTLGAVWRGRRTPLLDALLAEAQARASELK
jgi:DNA-binding transcriptional LysR family regulator